MKLRFFSLFALAFCFLFHSVAFAMPDETDPDTKVTIYFNGQRKKAILEDAVQHFDPSVEIFLNVGNYFKRDMRSAEEYRALTPLGKCWLYGKPVVNGWTDDKISLLRSQNHDPFNIQTTTTDLITLTNNRHPSRKHIVRIEIFSSHLLSEDFKNYFNELPDAPQG